MSQLPLDKATDRSLHVLSPQGIKSGTGRVFDNLTISIPNPTSHLDASNELQNALQKMILNNNSALSLVKSPSSSDP